MDAIMGQTMGGILFSILAGQPLIVIMTTAPIALYIKIIVAVAEVRQDCDTTNFNFLDIGA